MFVLFNKTKINVKYDKVNILVTVYYQHQCTKVRGRLFLLKTSGRFIEWYLF